MSLDDKLAEAGLTLLGNTETMDPAEQLQKQLTEAAQSRYTTALVQLIRYMDRQDRLDREEKARAINEDLTRTLPTLREIWQLELEYMMSRASSLL